MLSSQAGVFDIAWVSPPVREAAFFVRIGFPRTIRGGSSTPPGELMQRWQGTSNTSRIFEASGGFLPLRRNGRMMYSFPKLLPNRRLCEVVASSLPLLHRRGVLIIKSWDRVTCFRRRRLISLPLRRQFSNNAVGDACDSVGSSRPQQQTFIEWQVINKN